MFPKDGMEREKGLDFKEARNETAEIRDRAQKLYRAYEKNVASLLENKGLQHGAPDPQGHMHHAQQMLRILKTVENQHIDPYHWPEHFEMPKDIPIVFKDKEGSLQQREIPFRNFDNPKKLVDSIEEILTVAQIEGL